MLDTPAHDNAPSPDGGITPTPEMGWGHFVQYMRRNWNQGEHMTMIGTTGSGKTTLLKQLIGIRKYVVIFGVKGRDSTMDDFIAAGYHRIQNWGMSPVSSHLVLWPPVKGAGHTIVQKNIFIEAIDAIFREGGWCVVLDEASYLADTLGMEGNLKFLLQQGRSSGISVVGMTQRPAFIPLAFYDQATHLFLWRDNDRRNLQRIGELAGNARKLIEKEVADLRKREVLYIHKDTGFRVRTIVEV